jgi:hypothetical protein
VDPVEALRELGGVARRRVLLRVTSRKRLHRAVLRGEITCTSRGVYRLAAADLALVRAAELRGSASHLSAATLHGWEVAYPATGDARRRLRPLVPRRAARGTLDEANVA